MSNSLALQLPIQLLDEKICMASLVYSEMHIFTSRAAARSKVGFVLPGEEEEEEEGDVC